MFKKILVPVDIDQEASVSSLATAGDLAKKYGASLTLINVQATVPAMVTSYLPEGFPKENDRIVAARLQALAGEYKLGANTGVVVRHGNAHHEILAFAEDNGIDLILIASHHPGLSDYLLGSTAGHVVRHAQCSVLVLRL
jgi:nucleotide-binding universal stress UspA family protein